MAVGGHLSARALALLGVGAAVVLVWAAEALGALGALGGLRAGRASAALRALVVSGMVAVPAVAAMGTAQRAEVPSVMPGVNWGVVAAMIEALDAAEIATAERALQTLQPRRDGALETGMGSAPAASFPPTVARWRELVEREIEALRGAPGLHEAVTPDLVLAVIAAESGGDPQARSAAQAVGLMQVLPTTLASLAARTPVADGHAAGGLPGRLDASDPRLNVRAGILYLDEAVRRHDGDVAWALAAYNAGIPTSLRARTLGMPLWPESDRFVARVLGALRTQEAGAAW